LGKASLGAIQVGVPYELGTDASDNAIAAVQSQVLRLHDQFCIVSLPYMDNVWSASERYLLSQHS